MRVAHITRRSSLRALHIRRSTPTEGASRIVNRAEHRRRVCVPLATRVDRSFSREREREIPREYRGSGNSTRGNPAGMHDFYGAVVFSVTGRTVEDRRPQLKTDTVGGL